MSRFSLGHILIKSAQLKQTVVDYEQLGFTVTYRADPSKAHNALIYLKDGSFLELFDPKPFSLPDAWFLSLFKMLRPLKPQLIDRYLRYIRSTEGTVADYALDSVPSERAAEHLQHLIDTGAKFGKRLDMSKKLQDGRKQTWWLGLPEDKELPFLMSAYDPPIPCTTPETTHLNGVTGIGRVVIDVPDLRVWAAKYEQLLGVAPTYEHEGICTFLAGKGHEIQLRQSDRHRMVEIHLVTSREETVQDLLRGGAEGGTSIFLHPKSILKTSESQLQ